MGETHAKPDKCRSQKLPGSSAWTGNQKRRGPSLLSLVPPPARWRSPPPQGPRGPGGAGRQGKLGRSYLPEEIPCGDSSAREPAASSSVRCRAGPPFSRTPGTNPESAKIASRPLPLPLLRSLSFLLLFLLFFFFKPLPPPRRKHSLPPPPTPGCSRSSPEAGEGGEVGAEVGAVGGKVATRKFKQTNTPTPRPSLPAPLGPKLSGRMRRAGAGDQAGSPSGAGGTQPESGPPASDWRATRSRAPGQSF